MSARMGRIGRAWERVRTEPGLKRNVTVLVALIALGLVTGGVVLSNQRFEWPWNSSFAFYASFSDAPGVSPDHGQEVRIAGVAVGQIQAADVDDHGHARLRLTIDPQYRVYDNATVVLRPKSPLNEMYIELNPGGPPGKQLADGDALPVTASQRPVQIDEALGHLDDNTRQALTELLQQSDVALASASRNLPGGLSATSEVARQLQPVVQALQSRRDALQRLVTSLWRISTAVGGDGDRLGELAAGLRSTLDSLGANSGNLNATLAQLPDLTTQLRQAMTSVQSLSDQLDPTLDNLKNAAGTLPGALNKLSGTVDQVGRTVDAGTPVVAKAAPVVRDLRPFVGELNAALPDLKAATARFDQVTAAAVPYLPDLGAFILNTRSVYSMKDGNGGILRGLLLLNPTSLPTNMLNFLTPAPR